MPRPWPRCICAICSPATPTASRASRCAWTTCCSTTPRTASPPRPCGCCSIWRAQADLEGWRARMFAGEQDQHDRGPRGPARRAAQPLQPADPGRRPGRHAGGQRRAGEDARLQRAGAQRRLARPHRRGRSPTSSTSASAAPTSGRCMVCEALKPYQRPDLRPHFVSNVDGAHLLDTLARARAGAHPVRRRVQDLHHPGDHDQRRLGARLAGRAPRRRGRGRQALRRGLDQRRGGRGVRHRPRQHVRVLGLGRRPLLAVVGDRAADRARGRLRALRGAARRRATPWTSTSAPRRSSATCR